MKFQKNDQVRVKNAPPFLSDIEGKTGVVTLARQYGNYVRIEGLQGAYFLADESLESLDSRNVELSRAAKAVEAAVADLSHVARTFSPAVEDAQEPIKGPTGLEVVTKQGTVVHLAFSDELSAFLDEVERSHPDEFKKWLIEKAYERQSRRNIRYFDGAVDDRP